MPRNKDSILALDVGSKRVGVAIARSGLRVPVALTTLDRENPDFWQQLVKITEENDTSLVVIGLPRGLDGQETAQTEYVRAFAKEFATYSALPTHWQDEALTSVKAEETLRQTGKTLPRGDIDALAACFILSDYLEALEVTP